LEYLQGVFEQINAGIIFEAPSILHEDYFGIALLEKILGTKLEGASDVYTKMSKICVES